MKGQDVRRLRQDWAGLGTRGHYGLWKVTCIPLSDREIGRNLRRKQEEFGCASLDGS